MKSDFIPKSQADLDTWEVNFKEKVTAVAQELRLNDQETAEVIVLLDTHRAAYATMISMRAEAKAATSKCNTAERDFISAARGLINRIKGAKGYTEAMGNQLKIVGSDSVFDKANAKPIIAVSKEANQVVLKFIKNKTTGVHIYCRRGSEKEFSFVAADTVSPYIDNRPNLVAGQGETREYKAWHFIDDTIIGQESDMVSITV